MTTRTWFITGCSTGFGRAIALAALERGDNVVATARDSASLRELSAAHPGRVLPLDLDVTDAERVRSAVAQAIERFGAIDVLVNNAGYGYRSAVEEADPADVAELFDTNLFGPIELIKSVLPGMRARRSGAIVNISSVAAVFSFPGSGYYSATKFALEGLSEGLRKEVEPLGIRVLLVEPGAFRTDFAGRSLRQSAVPIDDYAATAGVRRKEHDQSSGAQPGDPDRAAQAIIAAVEGPEPPFRLVLGSDAVDLVRAALLARLAELDAGEATGREADFPN